MDDYLEFEKDTKALKSIKLDDLSTDELHKYMKQLNNEIERVKEEIGKKINTQTEAEKYFK